MNMSLLAFSSKLFPFFHLGEPHTTAFSVGRTEHWKCATELLAAEPGAGSEPTGREEPTDLDD